MLLSKPIRTDDHTDQTFKLMALPDHARKTVILNMGAVQMYLISRCSSKMKNLLKKYISHIQFTLQLEINKSIYFIIRANLVDLGTFEIESLDQRTTRELFDSDNFDYITTYWNDVFHGAWRVYKKLLDRFACQGRICTVRTVEDSIDIPRLIKWTDTLEPKLSDIVMIVPENVNEKRYSHIIKTMEQLHSVNIHLHSKRYFETVDIGMKGKRFFVHFAEWVTLDYLFKWESELLYLTDVQLTDAEIKTFLNTYINNETCQTLEHMTLRLKRYIDVDSVFDGLVLSKVEVKDVRKIGKYGMLADATNQGFFRVVMRNKEICYIGIDNRNGIGEFCICNFKDEVFDPFKLMKFPSLALEEVIKNMSLIEAFNFSFCSPTLRYFVKHIFRKQKLNLSIEIAHDILFRLNSLNGTLINFEAREHPKDMEELDQCRRMKIGNASRIPFFYYETETNVLVTYWRDIVKGATELYTLILELFNIHFKNLEVIKEKINYDYESVVGWISQINIPIEDVWFGRSTIDDTLFSQTIQCKNFPMCIFDQKPSEHSKFPEFRFTAIHVNWVIHNSHWITLDNLSDIGSVCLKLDTVKITDQEINLVFKNLINGKFRNLEVLALGVNRREMNRTVIMDGITDLVNNQENREVRVFDRHGYNLTLDATVDVQMTTGETCSFSFHRVENEDGLQSEVYVIIWK